MTDALLNKPIKTRFAPSPTGYLHVGGARTALYAWLFAKRYGGSFVLRIEDTDRERSTQQAVDAILEGMSWLGLDCDEGPYYQTQRFARYREVVQKLLDEGHAYRCYCSKERLHSVREAQQAAKQKPRYDGHCRNLSPEASAAQAGQPYVVRFKTPLEGKISFHDAVHGMISVANSELDDLIIQRSDGVPTYHLSVVVDDWDTAITHVIRGDDHINNTPRQIHMLHALGAPIPQYAHVPMILGTDGKRLSKRHGAVSVLQYREQGILAQALLNYLLRLGWSHGDQEIFSMQEMESLFNLEHISHAPAAFDEQKLLWLNQHYLKLMPGQQLVQLLKPHLDAQAIVVPAAVSAGADPSDPKAAAGGSATAHDEAVVQSAKLEQVALLLVERAKSLVDLAAMSQYFFQPPVAYDAKAQRQLVPATVPLLRELVLQLAEVAWTEADIKQLLQRITEQFELKLPKVAQPLRAALTGSLVSPSIAITIYLIGRTQVLQRLAVAMEWIAQQSQGESM